MSWDKARPIVAIALCLIIWAAYFKWFSPKGEPPKKKPAPAGVPAGGGGGTPAGGNGTGVEKPPADPPKFTHPEVAAAEFVLENDALRAEFQTRGGSLRRLILRQYGEPADKKKPLAFLDEYETGFASLSLRDPAGAIAYDRIHWEPVAVSATELRFRYTHGDGLRFTKIFTLGPEKHAIRLKLEIENLSAAPLARSVEVVGAAGILQEATGGVFPTGAHGLWRDGRTYSIETDDLDLKELVQEKPFAGPPENISWVGVRNKFFAAALFPADRAWAGQYRIFPVFDEAAFARLLVAEKIAPGSKEAAEKKDWTAYTLGCAIRTPDRTWAAGEKTTGEWVLYAGPLLDEALSEGVFGEQRLPDILDFGMFGFISRILLWILHAFHWVFRNYGLAIIGLVLVVRMAIFPISRKAQVSMFRMQKLQPQLKAIQDKFKGDPQRMNAESLKLMREQGVNPFGGCLPLFLQIPIFLGLYNALLYAIELRQQSFVSWINDLSQPDNLFTLPFSVFGQTQFHLLPLVMTVTWFTQAYLQPRSPDPQMAAQQKMFMFMPVVIGVMMYSTPSGLVLYWLVSTAWGIAEQQFIKKAYLK